MGAILAVAFLLSSCGPKPPPPPTAVSPSWKAAGPEPTPAKAGAKRRSPVPIIRVGIAPDAASAAVSSEGTWRLGVVGGGAGVGGGAAVEEFPGGTSWEFWAQGRQLLARDEGGRIRNGSNDTLYAFPADGSEEPLRLDGRPYRGEMLIFSSGGDRITVVNVIDLESYLRGVVPAEIGRAGPDRIEAVKAQTVAARSYTLAYLNRWRARGFDLLASVEDQVYVGMNGERDDVDQALKTTTGVVAFHGGQPIEAFYSSTCGGITAAPDEVWDRPARAYLRARRDRTGGREDPFCSASPYHRWSETWTREQLEEILRQTLPGLTGESDPGQWGRLRGIEIGKRTQSRRVEEVEIVFEKRRFTVGRDAIRWILRPPTGALLRSSLILGIDIQKAKGTILRVTMTGAGFGHGVGLCQYGALGMARAGYDYRQILRFYYEGIRLVRAYHEWPG